MAVKVRSQIFSMPFFIKKENDSAGVAGSNHATASLKLESWYTCGSISQKGCNANVGMSSTGARLTSKRLEISHKNVNVIPPAWIVHFVLLGQIDPVSGGSLTSIRETKTLALRWIWPAIPWPWKFCRHSDVRRSRYLDVTFGVVSLRWVHRCERPLYLW